MINQYAVGTYSIEEEYTPKKTRDGSKPSTITRTLAHTGDIMSTLRRLGRNDLMEIVSQCRERVQKAILKNDDDYDERQYEYRLVYSHNAMAVQLEKHQPATEKMEARWLVVKWVAPRYATNHLLDSIVPVGAGMSEEKMVEQFVIAAKKITDNPHWYVVKESI